MPGFGVPTHAEAKDVLTGAMLRYARLEAEQGAVQRPRGPANDDPTVALIGELFPADPVGVCRRVLKPMGLGHGAAAARRANGATSMPGSDSVVAAAIHPFYVASVREFKTAGRPVVGLRAGRGRRNRQPGWKRSAKSAGISPSRIDAAKAMGNPARSRAALDANPINAAGDGFWL